MNAQEAKKILDKVVGQVFGYQNPLSLEQAMQKFAFDIKLPQQVFDATDGSQAWAQSTNPTKFIKMENARTGETGMRPTQPISDLQELFARWEEVNYFTTDRLIDSINVAESDNIQFSENVYRSQDIRRSKNILFSDGMQDCEFIVGGRGVGDNTFCIRIEDAGVCANSFSISYSTRITNSMFMHDCVDMQDSMFCTNMKNGQYCIANMQFEKEEYERIRLMVVQWVLSPQEM